MMFQHSRHNTYRIYKFTQGVLGFLIFIWGFLIVGLNDHSKSPGAYGVSDLEVSNFYKSNLGAGLNILNNTHAYILVPWDLTHELEMNGITTNKNSSVVVVWDQPVGEQQVAFKAQISNDRFFNILVVELPDNFKSNELMMKNIQNSKGSSGRFRYRDIPCITINYKLNEGESCAKYPCSRFSRCEPLILSSKKRSYKVKKKLTIMTLLRDEAEYLEEWLAYHLIAGVEYFFIYDNRSQDRILRILQPWIDAGLVTYVYWPDEDGGRAFQLSAINDAYYRFKEEMGTWNVHIDVDEFFVYPKQNKGILDTIEAFHESAPENWLNGQYMVPWYVFGSSGHYKKPKGFVTESYHRRMEAMEYPGVDAPDLYRYFRESDQKKVVGGKSIVLTSKFKLCYNSAHVMLMKGGAKFQLVPPEVMHINHYYTKSFEDWRARLSKRNVLEKIDFNSWRSSIEQFESVEDDALVGVGPQIHSKIREVHEMAASLNAK